MNSKPKEKMKKLINKKSVFALIGIMMLTVSFMLSNAYSQTQTGFTLTSLDGKTVSSTDLQGKVVVLAVAASWVPLSQNEAKSMKQLAANHSDVAFYWVFIDSTNPKSKNYATDDQLRQYARTHLLQMNVLRDSDGVQMKKFGVTQVPAFVVLDKNGKRFGQPLEGVDPDGDSSIQLEKIITAAQRTPTVYSYE